jgi:hypothetical protein
VAIRLRVVQGKLIAVCAACTVQKQGDVYLDDAQHYALMQKFDRDLCDGACNDEQILALVEAEESNNPAREWWDKTYGNDGRRTPAGHSQPT